MKTKASRTRAIRIDDRVFEAIQKHARPFESPNNCLRRLLGLPPRGYKRGR